jgi:hypothetical protein
MIEINLNTVEDLILKDSRLRTLLPDLQTYFDTWLLGQHAAGLKSLASRTKVDLLHAIQPQHLATISKYLGDEVSLRTFDSNIVANRNCTISDSLECLDGLQTYAEIAVYRDGENIKITAWR